MKALKSNKVIWYLVIVPVICFLLLSTSGKHKLKPQIKSFTHIDYDIKRDSTIKKISVDHIAESYAKDGKLLLRQSYGQNGCLTYSTQYLYNDTGLLTQVKGYYHTLLDSILYQNYIYYDSGGHTYELMTLDNSKNVMKGVKTVDNFRDSIVIISNKENYIYSIPKLSLPRNFHKFNSYFQNKFDKEGRLIESIKPVRGQIWIQKFNKKQQIIEVDIYTADSILDTKNYNFYNKRGEHIRTNTYRGDTLVERTIDKYTYDKFGNWTIDSTFNNDTLTYIRTHQFEYY